MKRSYLIFIFALLSKITIAQDIDKEFDEFLQKISRGFDSSLKSDMQEFNSFLDSINAEYFEFAEQAEVEFIGLLNQSFSNYSLNKPEKIKLEPKPINLPVKEKPIIEDRIISLQDAFVPERIQQEHFTTIPSKSDEMKISLHKVSTNFIGHDFIFLIDTSFVKMKSITEISPSGISKYYTRMNSVDYQSLLHQLNLLKSNLNLNDWGYFLLVNELTRNLSIDNNTQKFLKWFLLLKAGFKTKIGYAQNELVVLFAPFQRIYETPYLIINSDRYYLWNSDLTNISTYDCEYFNTVRYFDMYQQKPLLFAENRLNKVLNFKYNQETYKFNLTFDKNYIDYFANYPILDLHYYFITPVSSVFKESVNNSLRPVINNMNQKEALNFLLALVQHSFPYKTDKEQFGHEKYMLPEELLYYKYSDCDDRTSLFVYLVNELLRLNTIVLEFDGHVCPAVEVTDSSIPQNLIYNNKYFTICDPTYIGAFAGMVMPPYQPENAKVIDINLHLNRYWSSVKIRDKLYETEGLIIDNNESIVRDRKNNVYASGIFYTNPSDEEVTQKSGENHFRSFLVKIDNNYEKLWTKKMNGTGNNYCYGLVNSSKNNLFVFGYFDKTIHIDSQVLHAKKDGDYFVAKFTNQGNLIWLKKLPLSQTMISNTGFSAIIDSTGKVIYLENPGSFKSANNRISIDDDENCNISGKATIKAYIMDTAEIYLHSREFDLISYLVNSNRKLIRQNYPQTSSLIYALFDLMNKVPETILNGNLLQHTIDSINSKIPINSPILYKNIGKIEHIQNTNGLLTIRTIDKQPVILTPLKAENNSLVRLGYQHENVKLEVLNGITIGNAYNWFNVNHIVIDKVTGEIIYNYDNHYQKKLPVQSELLR